MTTAPGSPLARLLATAVDRSMASLRQTDPDAAADLEHLAQAAGGPSVVLVGETNRGKSSLLNALVGVPGLSPVDAAAATASYLAFRYATPPAARAYVPGHPQPVPLELSGLRDWAMAGGRVAGEVRPPRRIEVDYDAPLLRDLALIDTPGAGGLEPAHTEVALDAVQHATALLFVADAAAPLSRPEIDFLVEASRRVDSVILALTKVDVYPGWRTILADNRALLQAHAARFATAAWFPVSARLAELATRLPPESAAALDAESGVTALRRALTDLAGKAHLIHHANVLRGVRSELVRLDAAVGERLRATDPDPDEPDRLRQGRAAALARHRTEARHRSLTLQTETERARAALLGGHRVRLGRLQQELIDRIDRARGEDLASLPDAVDRGLHALSVQLSRDLRAHAAAIGEQVLAEAVAADDLPHVRVQVNATLRHTLRAPRPGSGADNVLIALSAGGLAFMVGRGAVAGASALGAGAIVGSGLLIPMAGVGLGLAAGAYVYYRRRVVSDRHHARSWLREVIAEARVASTEEITERLTGLRHALTLAVDTAREHRMRQLDAHLAELERALARDRADRAARRAALHVERDGLRARIAQLDEVLARAARLAAPGSQST